MTPKERDQQTGSRPSFLTWKSAAIVLASAGAGYFFGSEKARSRLGEEFKLYSQGFKNAIKKREDEKKTKESRLKAGKMLAQVFPQGLRAEK